MSFIMWIFHILISHNFNVKNRYILPFSYVSGICLIFRFLLVRLKGLEPPRREAPDPKSGVATNYTTAASVCGAKVILFYLNANVSGRFYS